MNHAKPLEPRFWQKIDKSQGLGPGGDCWEWRGSIMHTGYGVITVAKKVIRAHRLSYQLTVGAIPDGMLVRHTCDNRICCNPDHLTTGTNQDNTDDMMARGRHYNLLKTHCKRGHPLSGENLITKKGQRACRACYYESNKKAYQKRKAAGAQ